ncbi:MAG: protein-L-isoaspartate(D-aspartate) O-methyltransferase [Gammaproteobacteria bacterium]|nr:protein-L-isoaspartate(D-aspartate) O-methyltransferase [Gammaproteobacteria bacterium]
MTARMRLQPEAIGLGMTSQRVRDRLIERLRAGSHRDDGIHDERVLNAIRTVPRHLFVDEALATRAYEDTALPIGHGQTISQPWVVAKMTEALFDGLQPAEWPLKVLEVGTGSGYQAAILAALGLEVYTVERIGELLRTARKRFRTLGMNIRSKHDDGRIGWPENAPYDAILVTAAAPALVEALTAQLAPGGTLVAPVGGSSSQSLQRLRRDADGVIEQTSLAPVVFVPLLSGMID